MLNLLRSFTAAVLLGLAVGVAHAADCSGRHAAGYRVLTLDSGRKVAVWYPAAADEKPFPYARSNHGFMGSVAFEAPPAACRACRWCCSRTGSVAARCRHSS
jgi:hypothetical protein